MFTIKCEPEGGEVFTVRTTSRAITAWENAPGQPKTQPRRSISTLVENMRMTDLVDLAWFAASRQSMTDLDIVQWRDLVDIDVTREDQESDDEESGVGPT